MEKKKVVWKNRQGNKDAKVGYHILKNLPQKNNKNNNKNKKKTAAGKVKKDVGKNLSGGKRNSGKRSFPLPFQKTGCGHNAA